MRKALAISIIIISILLVSNLYGYYLLANREEHTFTMNTIVKVYINDKLVYIKKGDMFNKNIEGLFGFLDAGTKALLYKSDGNTINIEHWDFWLTDVEDNDTRIIYAISDSAWDPNYNTVTLPTNSYVLDAESDYHTEVSGNTAKIIIIKYRLFEDTTTIYGSALASKVHYWDDSAWHYAIVLFCVDKFDSAITVNAGDVLKIEYDIVINP